MIPNETEGPYPGDGTNGANALALTGIVRSDITSSVDSASGKAEGVPLTIELTLVNTNADCAVLAGHAIYLWHCDRAGDYSMYTGAAKDENYLRGVQETDSTGKVTFQSIFPACYDGRWPHIHFEIFSSLTEATSGTKKSNVSQLAFPKETCEVVYKESGYEESLTNLAKVSLSSDNVFSDGHTTQLATMTGSVAEGYTAKLELGIAG